MMAQRHFHEFGTTREQLAQIALNARKNAGVNPKAIYRDPMSMADYLAARMISYPFCLYDCDVPVDGCTAMIVSHVDAAGDCRKPPLTVESVGTALKGRPSWDQWDDLTTMALRDAAAMLWERTDLAPRDVDCAQLYDGFSFITLAWLEALGFCGKGEGGSFIEGGARIARDGEIPLNTQGGQLSAGRLHGSAIAIIIGLALAYVGGVSTGGSKGLSDVTLFSGLGLMGGGMLRDLAIIATAYGVRFQEIKKAGLRGVIALFLGVLVSFVAGAVVAIGFGYTDPVDITTIAAGAVTYIVGPVTGATLGASSEVIALSIAAGLVKSILTMIATPLTARLIGLDNPRSAMIFGGLIGTTSGVAAGLAATDARLVPYGAMTATFYTGLGILLAPTVLFLAVRAIF